MKTVIYRLENYLKELNDLIEQAKKDEKNNFFLYWLIEDKNQTKKAIEILKNHKN